MGRRGGGGVFVSRRRSVVLVGERGGEKVYSGEERREEKVVEIFKGRRGEVDQHERGAKDYQREIDSVGRSL